MAAAVTLGRPEELAARTRIGDREAFVCLYCPDFDGLYDFALRTVRDRVAASEVVTRALARAWELYRAEGARFEVEAWLLGLLRSELLARPRARRRGAPPERDAFAYTDVDPTRLSESTLGFDRQLIDLVWDAATTFDREDYSLLDLHLRRDLSVDQLADHLGLQRESLAWRLTVLCTALEDYVRSTLLATRARHNCEVLDAALSANGADPRELVRRHIRNCSLCAETRRRFPSATEVFASFRQLPAPPGLSEETAQSFLAPSRRRARRLR